MKKRYAVCKANSVPGLSDGWNGKEWERANVLNVSLFRDESSSHRPLTKAKLLYNDQGIYGQFLVEDNYILSVNNKNQSSVCNDSCVEFFVKPKRGKGYLNFEMNCGGTMLCYYITDHTRNNGFAEYEILKDVELDMVEIYHSLPKEITEEITQSTEWTLAFFIPFSLLETFVGQIDDFGDDMWTANFYKCGDKTSHPHWASWSPITELNFHLPECFGELKFEK